MFIYDAILELSDDKEALDYALGMVWSECEGTEADSLLIHSNFVGTVQDIDVYYCYGADHYYFVSEGY